MNKTSDLFMYNQSVLGELRYFKIHYFYLLRIKHSHLFGPYYI